MPHPLPERRLILISGPQSQALSAAEQLIQRSKLERGAIYRHQADASLQSELGRDFSVVLVNAYLGLNPDSIGRVSGTIVAGGALIIVCPELSAWADYADPEKSKLAPYGTTINEVGDHYLIRWLHLLGNRDGPLCLHPDEVQSIATINPRYIDAAANHAITPDQQAAVDAICKAATGRRKHPAVITAARGRGKSAALGLAAGSLIQAKSCRDIVVTSSGLQQLKALFKHAQAMLPDSRISVDGKVLQHPHGNLRYVAADRLTAQAIDCDLLLVDEAASLGVFRLLQLLKLYPRLAFSSSEHGYEGSGRGFSLKFRQLIKTHCRGAYPVSLTLPIRWGDHDPLEMWTNELLLLEAATPALAHPADIAFEKLEFKHISQQVLANDEVLLKCVFALLVDAHYQTRPVDLRYLLDAPNAQLWAAQQNGIPIGLIWVMLEGGLDKNMAADIVAGRRRPQGHLIPQILAAHLGLDEAIILRCARIQRIVVHPDLQNRGLGKWMLKQLKSQLKVEVDYLASSFGADLSLSRFWIRSGYLATRLSDQAQATSGLRSALVINPLSKAAETMSSDAALIFSDQLVCQLASQLRDESPRLVLELAPAHLSPADMSANDLKAACLFAYALRPYESSLPALTHLARNLLLTPQLQLKLGADQAGLYIARILQNQNWDHCAQHAGLSGKKACLKSIRQSSQTLLEHLYCARDIDAICSKYAPAVLIPVTPPS